ncbi:MAG: HU family DNA-binding protein [Desulfotomaculales bacterium]
MTQTELVKAVADKTGLTRAQARLAVSGILGGIRDTLVRGDEVRLVGFGTFAVRNRVPRKGRDPQTGAEIEIPAKRVPVFRPGRDLARAVKA